MSKAIEKPSQTISEEISDTASWAQYCPDHQPSRHFHVSASAWSLPASRSRGRDKYTKSYQLFKKLVWVSSQLSSDTRGRTPVPSDWQDCPGIKSWFEWGGQESSSFEIPTQIYSKKYPVSSRNNDLIFLSLPLQSNWNLEVQQTLSIWILTAPKKDLLVHMATALLKRAEEFRDRKSVV